MIKVNQLLKQKYLLAFTLALTVILFSFSHSAQAAHSSPVPPDAPTDVAAESSAGYLQATITWTASTSSGDPAADYFVEVKMHNDVWSERFVNDDIAASSPLTDTIKLPAYGEYDIRIAAENGAGRSTYGTTTYITGDAPSHDISTCGELRAINTDPESGYADNYDLVADINCSGSDFPSIGWHETGFITAGAFSGIFNGHNHTINSIAIVDGGGDGRGFFSDAINATVENFTINGTMNSGGIRVGGIVGLGQNITVTNVTSGLEMTDSTAAGFGGIVGGLIVTYGTSDISNNSVLGNVTAMSGVTVGGLIGVVDMYPGGSLTINHNTVAGNTTGLGDSVGGLIGDVYMGANINDADSSVTMDHNTVTGTVDSTTGGMVGGLVGSIEQTSGSNSAANISITNSSASGTVSCEGSDSFVGGLIGRVQSEADGSGAVHFIMTGNSYTGTSINGGGNEYVGGLLGYYGAIENAGTGLVTYSLQQNFSTGNITGSGYLGGLIGGIAHDEEGTTAALISGTVSESYASGTVTDSYGSGNVGGFLGNYISNVENDGQLTLSDVYATGNVSSLGAAVGGLVGSEYSTGLILERTYASGSVTGSGTGDSGGGLVGYLGIGVVRDSFSTGAVSGFTTQAGGLIGGSNDSAFSHLFYDQTASGQPVCIGTGGVGADCIAASAATFKNSTTNPPYSGGVTSWDFSTVWFGHSSAYPTLRIFSSSSDPILIIVPPVFRSGGHAVSVTNALPVVAPEVSLQTHTQLQSPVVTPFTKNLKKGMTDPEVQKLQVFLNTHGFRISSSGVGSQGNETNFFGAKTLLALARYQKVNKISPQSGYFGPQTRESINQKLTA